MKLTKRITITLDEETLKWLDRKIENKTFHNYQHAIEKLLTEKIEETRFRHFNCYEDHVTIFDEVLNRLVNIYNKDGILSCDYHQRENCDHVRFAYTLKEIQKAVEEGKIKRLPFRF